MTQLNPVATIAGSDAHTAPKIIPGCRFSTLGKLDTVSTIIKSLITGHAVVDSIPGSGKTTTIIKIVKYFLAKKTDVLVLTYNTRLRKQTIERMKAALTPGSDPKKYIHTFHSYVSAITGNCIDDSGIQKYLAGDPMLEEYADPGDQICSSPRSGPDNPRSSPGSGPDNPRSSHGSDSGNDPKKILIIDEAQDLSELYHDLVIHIFSSTPGCRLLLLGDRNQAIFSYNGSTNKYLTTPELLDLSGLGRPHGPSTNKIPVDQSGLGRPHDPSKFTRFSFDTSHRLTPEMCEIINKCLSPRGSRVLTSAKPAAPGSVVYHYGSPEAQIKYIVSYIMGSGLCGHPNSPGSIFVLAPTTNLPIIGEICKQIRGKKYIILNESVKRVTEEVIGNAVVFSSYHRVKGLERDIVFVLNFDYSYMYYRSGVELQSCPDALYVAYTRARSKLILMHTAGQYFLPFIRNPDVLITNSQPPGSVGSGAHTKSDKKTGLTNINPKKLIKPLSEILLEHLNPGCYTKKARLICKFANAQKYSTPGYRVVDPGSVPSLMNRPVYFYEHFLYDQIINEVPVKTKVIIRVELSVTFVNNTYYLFCNRPGPDLAGLLELCFCYRASRGNSDNEDSKKVSSSSEVVPDIPIRRMEATPVAEINPIEFMVGRNMLTGNIIETHINVDSKMCVQHEDTIYSGIRFPDLSEATKIKILTNLCAANNTMPANDPVPANQKNKVTGAVFRAVYSNTIVELLPSPGLVAMVRDLCRDATFN